MSIVNVVHCIDTEGPLDESIEATFDRIRTIFGLDLPPMTATLAKLQRRELNLDGLENAVALAGTELYRLHGITKTDGAGGALTVFSLDWECS